MTQSRMLLLIFRLVISIGLTGGIQHEFIKEITAASEQRSLILIYDNASVFRDFSASLDLPSYNIYLPEVNKFNGEYDGRYDIRVTFEESKLYFVFLNELDDFYSVLPAIRRIYFWRDRDRVVVVIGENYNGSDLKPIFLFCFQFYIINIAFAFLKDEIQIFSYNPFSGDYSLGLDPRDLFPDKFRDLYGYQLKISMFPSVDNPSEKGVYQGRDGMMSRTISRHINATYTYVHPRVTGRAPVLNQYDDVAERVVHVGFNTRYVKFNFKNLIEKTYPHDRDDLACFTPKIRAQKFSGLTSLLSQTVWLLSLGVSLFFFAYVAADALIRRRRVDVVHILMTLLLLLFNKPVKERRNFNFRLALVSYLIFCFFLNTVMVCRLTSILTAPEPFRDIDTVKELAETDYEILTIDRFQELLNASLLANLKTKIFPRLTIIDEPQYLPEMRKCRNVVFICKDHLAHYARIQPDNYPNGVQFYRVMKEKILPTLSCYIVSYGSPFLARLDTLVSRIVESGINEYWKRKTWHKLGMHDRLRLSHDDYRSGVSLADMWMGSQILLYGLGASFLVFLLEVASIKILNTSKLFPSFL